MEGIPQHVDECISAMEEEEMQTRIEEQVASTGLSLYWVMRKLLAKTMMEREGFGDLVMQVLKNMKEDMLRNLVDVEGVMDLAKAPFGRRMAQEEYPSMVYQWPILAQVEPVCPSSVRMENLQEAVVGRVDLVYPSPECEDNSQEAAMQSAIEEG